MTSTLRPALCMTSPDQTNVLTRDSDPLDLATRDDIHMPDSNGLLRAGEVIDLLRARGIGITYNTWYWLVRDGRAPAGTRLGRHAERRWHRSDIEQWEKPPRKPRKPSATSATPRRLAAATRMGIDPAEYLRRRDAGERWCSRCSQWHHRSVFRPDPLRADGLAGVCYRVKTRLTRDSGTPESANV